MSKDKKIINPMLSGTLFPDGVPPMDYMDISYTRPPGPSAGIKAMILAATKLGYNVIYINLEE